MNKITCSECRVEFETTDDLMMCEQCDRNLKMDIKVLEVVKWLSFTFALVALFMFIPIMAAQETSSGYYELPGGKGSPTFFSAYGRFVLLMLVVLASGGFTVLGLWFGKKLSEKQSKKSNPLSIK